MITKKRPHSPDNEENLKYWRRRLINPVPNINNCIEFILEKLKKEFNITDYQIVSLQTKVTNIFILYTQLNNNQIDINNLEKLVTDIQKKLNYEKSLIYEFFNYETMYLKSIGYF